MATGSTGNPSRYGKLRDLIPTRRPPPLQVIVTKTWRVQSANTDTLDFIVMEVEGDHMHGWIPQRLISAFQEEICENGAITITDFRVVERRNKYCSPVTNRYNIVFTEATKVLRRRGYLHCTPEHFGFTEYEQLPLMIGKANFLADVISALEVVGQTRYVSSTRKLRELYICNERDEILKVNFWDKDIDLIAASLPAETATPILAITSTTVTDFGGKIGVTASHNTKILLTSDAPRTIKDIRTAIAKGATGYNLCRASVQQVYEDEGWKYFSCTKCRKKVTLSGAGYWCFGCYAKETNPDERFKLQIQLADKHGLLDVTVFSETASELLDISFAEMNDLNKKGDTGVEEIHNLLMKAVGKEFLFRVRVDDYNVRNPDKALTVSSISNVSAPPNKRARTTPTCARQLPLSSIP